MKRQHPDISMCWDGQTPTAELLVDGAPLVGPPVRVENIFETLVELRARADEAEKRLENLRQALDRIRP